MRHSRSAAQPRHSAGRGEPPRSTGGEITIHFETDRLDALVLELKERGVAFEQEPTDQPYRWREATLRDPGGPRLFLCHAGVNRLDPPWRLREER